MRSKVTSDSSNNQNYIVECEYTNNTRIWSVRFSNKVRDLDDTESYVNKMWNGNSSLLKITIDDNDKKFTKALENIKQQPDNQQESEQLLSNGILTQNRVKVMISNYESGIGDESHKKTQHVIRKALPAFLDCLNKMEPEVNKIKQEQGDRQRIEKEAQDQLKAKLLREKEEQEEITKLQNSRDNFKNIGKLVVLLLILCLLAVGVGIGLASVSATLSWVMSIGGAVGCMVSLFSLIRCTDKIQDIDSQLGKLVNNEQSDSKSQSKKDSLENSGSIDIESHKHIDNHPTNNPFVNNKKNNNYKNLSQSSGNENSAASNVNSN